MANAGIKTPTKGIKKEGRHEAAKSALHEFGKPYILSIRKRCIFLLVIFHLNYTPRRHPYRAHIDERMTRQPESDDASLR